MSVMAAELSTFVDTNVLIYAYDRDAGDKHEIAKALLGRLWNDRNGSLSTQVLQEFYVTATRKLADPLSREVAREAVRAYARWQVQRVGVVEIIEASQLEEQHHLSFWDALIVVSAQRAGARRLCTEDLQAGRDFNGLVVENPFA